MPSYDIALSGAYLIAVATLTEPAAIILAEDVILADDALEGAKNNGITVLSSPLSAYELCAVIDKAVSEKSL